MTYTPEGFIYLCKCPLENDYKNQLTFTSYEEQENYFNSIVQKSYSDYTYIKKDNVIKVNSTIDEIINCNYLFYKNSSISNKIYYCFITRMEYVNTDVTAIYFETDAFQTYWANISYNSCFIEREHVNNDTIGSNLVPEGLETGEYVIKSTKTYNFGTTYICIATTDDIFSVGADVNAHFYNGVPTGIFYYLIKDRESFSRLINILNGKGEIDTLVATFLVPASLVGSPQWKTYDNNVNYDIVEQSNYAIDIGSITITRPNTLGNPDTYTPKNKKLLTYPYIYLATNNNVGTTNVYRFEEIEKSNDVSIQFNLYGNISIGCDIRYVLDEYKNKPNNFEYGFNNGKFPQGSWSKNTFNNWFAQNGLNIASQYIGNTIDYDRSKYLQTFNRNDNFTKGWNASIFSANYLNKTLDLVANVNYHAMQPNTASGDVGNSSIAYSFLPSKLGATFDVMSIRSEFAKIIDDYFSMYGYKINRVKAPNITGRQNWNFVKTINCNFSGNDIPQTDLQTIRNMFDNGVTLWHNPNTMYNYNNSNNIV